MKRHLVDRAANPDPAATWAPLKPKIARVAKVAKAAIGIVVIALV